MDKFGATQVLVLSKAAVDTFPGLAAEIFGTEADKVVILDAALTRLQATGVEAEEGHTLLRQSIIACIGVYAKWGATTVILDVSRLSAELAFEDCELASLPVTWHRLDHDLSLDKTQSPSGLFFVHDCPIGAQDRSQVAATIRSALLASRCPLGAKAAVATSDGDTHELLSTALVQQTLSTALVRAGAAQQTANYVALSLLTAEQEGYASHGLMRAVEYLEAIESGVLEPRAEPTFAKATAVSGVVDGRRSFGCLAARTVADNLNSLVDRHGIALVGLQNSNHMGRLAELAKLVTERGHIVIGFVNFLGAGQKSMPWHGTEPKFSTNPIVFGFPRGSAPAVIMDLTSTVVSEGKVRAYLQQSRFVESGWLMDRQGHDVCDPSRLYTSPMQAFLRPLGADAGHKGYALALAVEILAGVLSGAGHVAKPQAGGNAGTFIALRPDLLGLGTDTYVREITALIDYLKATAPLAGTAGVEIPGERAFLRLEASKHKACVTLPKEIWRAIMHYSMR